MYLTIKRKDSVSSILLFIFNVFLVERGMTEIPLRKIFRLMEPFHKNETAVRMGLSREVQNGLLINEKHGNEVFYRITDKVIEGFRHWKRTMDFNREKTNLQLADWTGKWSILAQTDQSAKRDDLTGFFDLLHRMSFGNLNKTIWFSPYDIHDQIETLLNQFGAEEDFVLFEGSLAGFAPEKQGAFIRKMWSIDELAARYRNFLDAMNEAARKQNDLVSGKGDELPFLFRFGLDYFEIVQDDPRLPLAILPPDWPGIEAARTFNGLREALLPGALEFVENILE